MAKATVAVIAVSAVAAGGAAGTGAFDGSPPASVAREPVTAVDAPPVQAARVVAANERGGKPKRSSRPRPKRERHDRRTAAGNGRALPAAPATTAEGAARAGGGDREQRQPVRPQPPPRRGSGAPEHGEPPGSVEDEDEYEAPDEPDSAEEPEYEAPDEPDERS